MAGRRVRRPAALDGRLRARAGQHVACGQALLGRSPVRRSARHTGAVAGRHPACPGVGGHRPCALARAGGADRGTRGRRLPEPQPPVPRSSVAADRRSRATPRTRLRPTVLRPLRAVLAHPRRGLGHRVRARRAQRPAALPDAGRAAARGYAAAGRGRRPVHGRSGSVARREPGQCDPFGGGHPVRRRAPALPGLRRGTAGPRGARRPARRRHHRRERSRPAGRLQRRRGRHPAGTAGPRPRLAGRRGLRGTTRARRGAPATRQGR